MADRKLNITILGKDKASKAFDSVGDRLKSLAKVAVAAGAATTVATGAAFGKMISMASDAAEAQSKFNIVFAETGDEVVDSLDAFARAVGRSKYELRSMASTFGDTFKPMGFTEEAAADLSVTMSNLATDLSSFNNMEMDEALRRLQGTLIGSHENALAFGVIINENTLKAELAANGWDTLTGAQLEQAKVQARINLLMKGTIDAQGDAARTAKGWANQTRALKAIISDTSTEIGLKFLPPLEGLLSHLVGFAGDVAPRATAKADELAEAFSRLIQLGTDAFTTFRQASDLNWIDRATIEPLHRAAGAAGTFFGQFNLAQSQGFSRLDSTLYGIERALDQFLTRDQMQRVYGWTGNIQQAGYRLEELKERVDAFIDIDAEQISGMLTTAFAIMLPGGGLFKGLALLREAYENNWLGIQETTEQVSAAVKAALQSLDVDGDGLTLTDVLGGVQQSIANFDVNSAAAALEQKIGAIFGGLNTGVASKGFGDTLRRALAGVDLSQSIKDAIDRGWAAIDKLDLGPKAIDFTIAAMNFGTWIATEAGEIITDALRGAMTAEEGDFGDWLLNEWWPAVFPSAAEFATAVASSAAGILNGLSDAVLAHGAKTREAIIDAIFPREQDMVDGWAVAAGAISPGTPSIDWGAWFDQIDASLQAWIDGGGAGRLGERIVRALYDFMSIETFFGPSDGDEVVAGLFGVLADAIARNDGSVITGAIKNYFSNALKNLWDDWTPDLSGFAKGIQESLSRAFSGGTGGGGKVPGLPSPERPGALSIDWSGLLLNGMDQASTELGAKLGEINAAIAGMVTDATAILMEGGLLLTSWAQGTTALFETMWQGIYESSLMMGQRTGAYLTGPFVGHIEEMRAGAALGLQGVVSEFQPIPLQISGIFGEHDWGSIGRAISYGIAADITSAPIIAAVRAALQQTILAAEQEMGIASPAKVPGRRIGAPIGQGIAVYLIDSLRDAAPSVQRALDNMLPRAPALSFAGSPTALRTTSATAASRTMSDNRQITNHLTLSLPAGTPEAIAERALEMIADGLEGL